MKKLFCLIAVFLLIAAETATISHGAVRKKAPRFLFVNASPNANGNTAALAAKTLGGRRFETLNLVDYRVNVYGQKLPGDQFPEVLAKIRAADVIVFGSPVYWHNISGTLRTLIDRFYGAVDRDGLKGKKMAFLFQGQAPQKWMLEAGEYTMKGFASLYGLDYLGMATNAEEAAALSARL